MISPPINRPRALRLVTMPIKPTSSVAAVAVTVGKHAGHLLNPKVTQKVAAVLFALVGVALIAGII